ncbi:AI-2E family transporter [Lentilactobacillus senioris]|uniref:AI-2E family transporter n=1 Tax=Lentilactobacillus senioris TaxID=931534 RepID=UPI00227FAF32|nr:AI-2E family transporter [Lentilactobacillus senioris]MCY9806702.1 AI-2E family transporter [Lentilactobacillus senioris]
MIERLKKSSLMFWSLEILIVVGIIAVCTKISFLFSPIAIFISTIFVPIILAGFLFYMLNPIVNLIMKIKLGPKKHISRTWAVSLVFILLVGVIVFAAVAFLPKLSEQVTTLLNHVPDAATSTQNTVQHWLNQLNDQQFVKELDLTSITDKIEKNITSYANSILKGVTSGVGSIVSTATNVVIVAITTPVVLFYMLKDGYKLAPNIKRFLPAKGRDQIMELLEKMSDTLSKYIGGQMIECLFVGTFTAIGYFIIGLDYALLLGVIAGICNIIPYLGPYIGIFPALAISLSSGSWMSVVYNIIVVLIVQQIDGNFVYPNVIGKSLQIHPLTIIIILLAAGNIAGIAGMILAIPLYAVVKVVVSYLYNIFHLNPKETS